MKNFLHYFVYAAAILMALATQAKESPIHEQGWIGGRYQCARSHVTWSDHLFGADNTLYDFPTALQPARQAGIFANELGTNTPAFRAGLRAGDLILDIAGKPATNLPAFWQAIRSTAPGTVLPLKAWRDGHITDLNVTVGRETYQNQGTFSIRLPSFWQPLHLIPTPNAPDFSLLVLGWQRPQSSPFEFYSVKQQYEQHCYSHRKPQGYNTDWKCWLVLFELAKGKQILRQEPVTSVAQVTRPNLAQ